MFICITNSKFRLSQHLQAIEVHWKVGFVSGGIMQSIDIKNTHTKCPHGLGLEYSAIGSCYADDFSEMHIAIMFF